MVWLQVFSLNLWVSFSTGSTQHNFVCLKQSSTKQTELLSACFWKWSSTSKSSHCVLLCDRERQTKRVWYGWERLMLLKWKEARCIHVTHTCFISFMWCFVNTKLGLTSVNKHQLLECMTGLWNTRLYFWAKSAKHMHKCVDSSRHNEIKRAKANDLYLVVYL